MNPIKTHHACVFIWSEHFYWSQVASIVPPGIYIRETVSSRTGASGANSLCDEFFFTQSSIVSWTTLIRAHILLFSIDLLWLSHLFSIQHRGIKTRAGDMIKIPKKIDYGGKKNWQLIDIYRELLLLTQLYSHADKSHLYKENSLVLISNGIFHVMYSPPPKKNCLICLIICIDICMCVFFLIGEGGCRCFLNKNVSH